MKEIQGNGSPGEYTFEVYFSGYTRVTVEADNYPEAEQIALDRAEGEGFDAAEITEIWLEEFSPFEDSPEKDHIEVWASAVRAYQKKVKE